MNKTKKYEIFKILENNRSISEKFVLQLMKSIQKCNLLEFKPIIVTKNLEVVDGQHRLEAAKRLGVDIYYNQQEESVLDAASMVILNANQHAWTYDDYLNFWLKQGNNEYRKITDCIKKYDLNLNLYLNLYVESRKNVAQKFMEGELKAIPMEKIEPRLNYYVDFLNFVSKKLGSKDRGYFKTAMFFTAFMAFTSLDDFDYFRFVRRLEQCLNRLRKCADKRSYLELLIEIYNFRNSSPIRINEVI